MKCWVQSSATHLVTEVTYAKTFTTKVSYTPYIIVCWTRRAAALLFPSQPRCDQWIPSVSCLSLFPLLPLVSPPPAFACV